MPSVESGSSLTHKLAKDGCNLRVAVRASLGFGVLHGFDLRDACEVAERPQAQRRRRAAQPVRAKAAGGGPLGGRCGQRVSGGRVGVARSTGCDARSRSLQRLVRRLRLHWKRAASDASEHKRIGHKSTKVDTGTNGDCDNRKRAGSGSAGLLYGIEKEGE